MTGPWRDVMLLKRVSRLDLWKYYSLYNGMWNLFCRAGHYPCIQNSSMVYVEEEPALQCRKQYYEPDSSSLKPGSWATEAVLD